MTEGFEDMQVSPDEKHIIGSGNDYTKVKLMSTDDPTNKNHTFTLDFPARGLCWFEDSIRFVVVGNERES